MGLGAAAELLRFERVSRSFVDGRNRGITALEEIDLTVQRGEFVSIIGPSGCGKSTLLRLAAGLDRPTSGRVLYHGQPIAGPDRRRGFVFQTYNAFPWLNVRDNIAFGIQQLTPELRDQKVSAWLDLTGLREFADRYPKVLSGGMRQRLALARAMVVEPELLLLDEPFGALDERTRREMQRLLLETVERARCSVLFVTHDIREAILLGDRVLLVGMRPGRILDVFVPSSPKPRNGMNDAALAALHETIVNQFPGVDTPPGG
ncbi:ABC transporter ATP-binding protein [Sorangium sp. So ce136]|uniref:ABC transporter ATP-binding protein n=1 Tax=Sorangium sp. So ce136 TaxID=3133284 RepID=UPI003EFBDBD3